jgi:hypothetical protein
MNWIPLFTNMPRHPKVAQLMELLGIKRPQAVGHLAMLWAWAMEITATRKNARGDLGPISPKMLAAAVEWTGDSQKLLDALVTCRFLDKHKESYRLHNWRQYGGKLNIDRQKDAARKREARSQYKTAVSGGHPATVQGKSVVEETKLDSIKEKIKEKESESAQVKPMKEPESGKAGESALTPIVLTPDHVQYQMAELFAEEPRLKELTTQVVYNICKPVDEWYDMPIMRWMAIAQELVSATRAGRKFSSATEAFFSFMSSGYQRWMENEKRFPPKSTGLDPKYKAVAPQPM